MTIAKISLYCILKDKDIPNTLYNYHIIKEKEDNEYDNFFKAKIEDELGNILSKNVHDGSYVFFDETTQSSY